MFNKIMKTFSSAKWKFYRLALDIVLLLSIALLLYFAPNTWFFAGAKAGLLNLFLAKMLFISAGTLHAHISRKLMFPYFDLRDMVMGKKQRRSGVLFLTIWYAVIIYAWARGG